MADGSSNSIALPAVIDLDALEGMRDGLLDAIDSGPLIVVGEAVERVSTNGLMLLLALAETARRNHFAFALEGASQPLRSAIERLGLLPAFAGILKG